MVEKTLYCDLEQVAYRCYNNGCLAGLHAASPILELRIVKQVIARLISA